MGKTPESLRCVIWVDDDYDDHPQINALRDKGHVIRCMKDITDFREQGLDAPHLIFSRVAHAWTPEMFDVKGLLDIAMKAARERKRA